MADHKYRLKYSFEAESGEFSAEECQKAGGGTDALILVSLIWDDEGNLSTNFYALDGRTGKDGKPGTLLDIDVFRWWSILPSRLIQSNDGSLEPWHRGLLTYIFNTIREVLFGVEEDEKE